MRAVRLRCEYLKEPLGLGNTEPRFFWNAEGGVSQRAYQIRCEREGEILWDTGKVVSSAMTHIRYEGKKLNSRDRVIWSVQLWDEKDEAGETTESFFEMGLLSREDWCGRWISGNYRPDPKKRYPVDCFRKEFTVSKPVKRARIYATARGIYDLAVDGQAIRDFVFAPGMTDYRRRIQYQTYDVTKYLEDSGSHRLVLRLADGWFRGSSAAYGVTNVYGKQTSLMAQLEITYEDGSFEIIGTDDTFSWSNDGPLRFADLKDGENYDARKTDTYSGKALIVKEPKGIALVSSDNVPVTEHEHFRAKVIYRNEKRMLLDFGQNLAGILSFTAKGHKGQRIRLICGEVTGKNGKVDLSGIQETRPKNGWSQISLVKKLLGSELKGDIDRTPHQEIRLICSGQQDTYQTSFAVFGFRYVQVDAEDSAGKPIDEVIDPSQIEAIAVYSDLEETGTFRCSNPKINRLEENTRWSMKGNFLDLPTDCPTRERLGWTGDAQVFFDTGAYMADTTAFFAKWLRDMEDAQYKNGLIPAVLPYQGVEMMYKATGSSVGWADAVYLIPWRYYLRYGDREMLEKTWPMMKRYADYLLGHLGMKDKKEGKQNPCNEFTYEKGVHLGEWLEPEKFRDKVYGTKAKHPEECTAYLYLTMQTMAKIASLLGKDEEQQIYLKTAEGAKKAYQYLAGRKDKLDTDRQAKLVRPLAFDLLDEKTKEYAAKRLVKAAESYDFCVGTGFLSTPFILPVLSETGHLDTAYRMLENEKAPGWLSEVNAGATTIWENWEGNLSQNHYSPGAVCAWLYDTVCGIRPDGERHFVIAPVPGGTLTWAEASYQSIYGKVSCRWEKKEDGYRFTIGIPANVTAEVILPDDRREILGGGIYEYEEKKI